MISSDAFNFFFPAVQRWLAGLNPYDAVYNPLWAWWIMTPAGAWSAATGYWIWMGAQVLVLLAALLGTRRAHPFEVAALLLAPAALVHLVMGQWALFLLLGVVLLQSDRPLVRGVGLLLLATKPNLGWPFLLLTRSRDWPVPAGMAALSLLLRPRWPLEALDAFLTTPPVAYDGLLYARSLGMGTPFLLGLGLGSAVLILWAARRHRPPRAWMLALLCCGALLWSPYHRLYDNVLLFFPILLLTRERPAAWLPILGLLWLPLLLPRYPWAVFVDWLPPVVLLLLLLRALPSPLSSRAASSFSSALPSTSRIGLPRTKS